MRKILFGLALVVGAGAFASGAGAAPFERDRVQAQRVEYREDWRAREFWRHRRHEEWRRHEMFREHDRLEHRHF